MNTVSFQYFLPSTKKEWKFNGFLDIFTFSRLLKSDQSEVRPQKLKFKGLTSGKTKDHCISKLDFSVFDDYHSTTPNPKRF